MIWLRGQAGNRDAHAYKTQFLQIGNLQCDLSDLYIWTSVLGRQLDILETLECKHNWFKNMQFICFVITPF